MVFLSSNKHLLLLKYRYSSSLNVCLLREVEAKLTFTIVGLTLERSEHIQFDKCGRFKGEKAGFLPIKSVEIFKISNPAFFLLSRFHNVWDR